MIVSVLLAALPVLYEGQDTSAMVKLPVPGVEYRNNVASATRAPWVNSNGWRILRNPGKAFYYRPPANAVSLALAEAHAFGAPATVEIAAEARNEFDRMLAFLAAADKTGGKPLANIAVVDDGSPQAGEAMNLLIRRNLLFRVVDNVDRRADLNARLDRTVTNPFEFAADVRQKLTDEKRLLRIYGSDVVLGRLYETEKGARLHLVNYGRRPAEGLRVRVRGVFKSAAARVFEGPAEVSDWTRDSDGVEFTIERLPVYGMIELLAK